MLIYSLGLQLGTIAHFKNVKRAKIAPEFPYETLISNFVHKNRHITAYMAPCTFCQDSESTFGHPCPFNVIGQQMLSVSNIVHVFVTVTVLLLGPMSTLSL